MLLSAAVTCGHQSDGSPLAYWSVASICSFMPLKMRFQMMPEMSFMSCGPAASRWMIEAIFNIVSWFTTLVDLAGLMLAAAVVYALTIVFVTEIGLAFLLIRYVLGKYLPSSEFGPKVKPPFKNSCFSMALQPRSWAT